METRKPVGMPEKYIKLTKSLPFELQFRVLEYSIVQIPREDTWIEYIDVILFVNPKTRLKLTRLGYGGSLEWNLQLNITNTININFCITELSELKLPNIVKKFECFDELNINCFSNWWWFEHGAHYIIKDLIDLHPVSVTLNDDPVPGDSSHFLKILGELTENGPANGHRQDLSISFLIKEITSVSIDVSLIPELLSHIPRFKSLSKVFLSIRELLNRDNPIPLLKALSESIPNFSLQLPDDFHTRSSELWDFLASNSHVTFDSIGVYPFLGIDNNDIHETRHNPSPSLAELIDLPNERIKSIQYSGDDKNIGLLLHLKHLERLSILSRLSLSNLKFAPVNSNLKELLIYDLFLFNNVNFSCLTKLYRVSIFSRFEGIDSASFNSIPYKVKRIELDQVNVKDGLHSFKVSKYLRVLICRAEDLAYFDFSNSSHLSLLGLRINEKIHLDDDIWDSLPRSVETLKLSFIATGDERFRSTSKALIEINLTKLLSPVKLVLQLNFRVIYVNCRDISKYQKVIVESQIDNYFLFYVTLKVLETKSLVEILMENDNCQWLVIPDKLNDCRTITCSGKRAFKWKSLDGYTIFEFTKLPGFF